MNDVLLEWSWFTDLPLHATQYDEPAYRVSLLQDGFCSTTEVVSSELQQG